MLNVYLLYNPAIPLYNLPQRNTNMCPHKDLYMNIYRHVVVIMGRRKWQPIPVLLPGKSHGWKSLVGYSAWGRDAWDMTEWLHFHFSLSCIGKGNGNPLQCSCLENPRDRGAWWAAVYGVAQSQTWLKPLSSSSSYNNEYLETTQMLKSQRIDKWIINLYNGILLSSEKKYLQ